MTHRILQLSLLTIGIYSGLLFSDDQQEADLVFKNFDWLTNGVKSGSLRLTINQDDGTRTARFEFNDRGRGPKIHEVTRFAADGQVSELQISGHSYMGAQVDEHLQRSDFMTRWRSKLEQGSSDKSGAFYLANDGTPEQAAMLARALLASDDGSLGLLPNGRASISELDAFDRSTTARTVTLSLYAINGIGMDPQFLWLDENKELFGIASGCVGMVPEGWAHIMGELQARQEKAEQAFHRARSVPLTHKLPAKYAITHVNVVDVVTGTLLENQSVTVKDGLIQSVSESTPDTDGLKLIDAMGSFLIPGLWDMHSHISLEQGLLHVAAGVTTIRDMGNNPEQYSAVRDSFDSGAVVGPRAYAAGFIDRKSPYSAPIKALAESQEEALELVRKYSDMAYPQIKIYSSIEPDWVAPIAKEVHARGMRLSGHIPSFMTAERAVMDGFDEIQHINMLFLNFLAGPEDDTRTPLRFTLVAEKGGALDLDSTEVTAFLGLLKTNEVVIDPTVAIFDNMFRHRSGDLSPSFAMVADHFPPAVKRGMLAGRMNINEENAALYSSAADALLKMLRKLYDHGIKIVAGTDSLPGFGLHRELELYQKAGIPAAEVLKLATLGAAELMGASGTSGSITVGKQADFVLLAANPLQDICAVRTTQLVFKGDRYYKSAQMYQAVGIKPFK